MYPLNCLALWGERGSLSLFLKNRKQMDFKKNLNNSILHLFRIVDLPVQQDTIVDAPCIKEGKPFEL